MKIVMFLGVKHTLSQTMYYEKIFLLKKIIKKCQLALKINICSPKTRESSKVIIWQTSSSADLSPCTTHTHNIIINRNEQKRIH